jgi:hypothetical protein
VEVSRVKTAHKYRTNFFFAYYFFGIIVYNKNEILPKNLENKNTYILIYLVIKPLLQYNTLSGFYFFIWILWLTKLARVAKNIR